MIAAAVWVATPVVALVVLTIVSYRLTPTGSQQSVSAVVRAARSSSTESADMMLNWRTPGKLLAPEWNGTVQKVHLRAGTKLETGSRVIKIDGVWRIAAHTDEPFYRTLAIGDSGSDVAQLHLVLRALHLGSETGSSFTSVTAADVSKLAQSLGAGSSAQFDPAWVLYLPSSTFTVATAAVAVGAPAPADGAALATGQSQLASGVVVPQGSFETGDGSAASVPEAQAVAVAIAVPAGSTVSVQGTSIALAADRVHVAAGALSAVDALVTNNQPLLQVNVTRPTQQGDLVVPAAAVVTGASGHSCVAVLSAGLTRSVPVEVVTDTAAGEVVVRGSLGSGARVRVSPNATELSCG